MFVVSGQFKQYMAINDMYEERMNFFHEAKKQGSNAVYLKTYDTSSIPDVFVLDVQEDSESWVIRIMCRYYDVDIVLKGEEYKSFNASNEGELLLKEPHVFGQNVILTNWL